VSARSGQIVNIVDDDGSTRGALARLLTAAGFTVRSYASAGAFLTADPDPRPACLLLDLEMPGVDGLALQQTLRRIGGTMPTLFMSGYCDIPRTVTAIKNGAVEFLVKPIESAELLNALDNAFAQADPGPVPLNDREQAVLRGIVAGRLNKEIAAELGLSERTIKSCRADLMHKLGARSLADLLRRGMAIATC